MSDIEITINVTSAPIEIGDLGIVLPGPSGLSAYQIAVANGFVGTEAEWLASLEGKDGGDYTLAAATADTLGGVKVGANLKIIDGVLSVDTATAVEQDNTKPITSAAVHTEVGNIEALLAAL
jgi:hypothetical protein